MAGANLGDPIEYGAYLMGQLTGHWLVRRDSARYEPNDGGRLPDFNLDSDRGYAYQCWDYTRHAASKPGAGPLPLDTARPDQWQCAPQLETILTRLGGKTDQQMADEIFAMYGYQEPLTVPQRYDAKDNPHHRSRYDPLKRLSHHYLPRVGLWPPGWDGTDLEVSEAEMLAAGMSPTGRRVP